ncbi:uncharacterized protein [Drosophila virilis]|uniref:uncharacterized protein n=1 Tax=Drosophila virilis TaxID=7244 RepID=UPI0038B25D57
MKLRIITLSCAVLVICLCYLPLSNGQDSSTAAASTDTTTAAASTDTTTAAASTDTTTAAASTDTTTAASSTCGGKKKRRKHKWKVVRHPGKKIIKRHRKGSSKWDLKG